MKKTFSLFVLTGLLMLSTPAHALFSYGIKAGLNINSISLSKEIVSTSNQAGFFVGPTVKLSLPLIGLGFDGSVVYDQRNAKYGSDNFTQHNINIPINIRYSVGLGSIASIFFAAGPQFGFNVGDNSFSFNTATDSGTYKLENSNISINVGLGVTLIKHLEVGASYNIACGNTGKLTLENESDPNITSSTKSRSNAWQISLTYYF